MIKRVLIVVAVTVVAVAAFTLWQSHGEAGHSHDEAEEHAGAVEMDTYPSRSSRLTPWACAWAP
ncbi:MAG: hypothetical protein SOX17_03250 [Prevotella sp.]|nr:hypothetical protein [Prevotella sp.]